MRNSTGCSMNFIVVSGSQRTNSESDRVGAYIVDVINSTPDSFAELISLSDKKIPLWDEDAWNKDSKKWGEVWTPVSQQLRGADGFVFITPEWSGMATPAIKNFFLLCSSQELAHKPGLLVAVSSGVGGSYPIAELRMSSYKNTKVCFIPDHVIVRNSGEMLKGEAAAGGHDENLRKRIDHSAKVLSQYAKALKVVRESGAIDLKTFPFGM